MCILGLSKNWEKGATSIPTSVSLALDKLFGDSQNQDVVSREEYNKVVEALNLATELNRKLSDIIQANTQANTQGC